MVFSSIQAYLDSPNWQQQPSASISATTQVPPPPLPPPLPPPQPHGSGGAIRPGSMADRARVANIPMPDAALPCPRCESTNTKFCYFNNYSLTQPRHFCKTCRRYWTRGGALRNVPVGGGCRRNKRSKGSSSKSPATSSDRQTASGSPRTISSGSTDVLGIGPQVPPLRFMAPLHHLTEFGTGDIGLNYGGISAPFGAGNDLNYQIGSALATGATTVGGSSLLSGWDQWRLQQAPQFPFFGSSLDYSSALNPFEATGVEPSGYGSVQVRPKISSSGVATPLSSVKMEENDRELNLSRQLLGMPENEQYWGGTAWTDLSSFSSSSTSNPM